MHQNFKINFIMLVVSLLLSVVTTSNFPSLIVSTKKKVYPEDNRTEEESRMSHNIKY